MRFSVPSTIVSALLLASSALAQIETITYPWAEGNTVVITVSTDALGDPSTLVLSTVTGPANPALNTALTTALTTPTTTARTRTRTATTTTAAGDGPDTTTGQRVVGQQETMAPMRTTTYWYDTGMGYWTSAAWTASVTAAPSIATAIVPQGTIANYQTYQSAVNKNVFSNAAAAEASQTGAAAKQGSNPGMAWMGVVAGAVGAGVLAVGL